jgi:NDP-sugar pyrophosphorylase family protein
VLAGGGEPRLHPLTGPEHPKCLLPVANSPVILYSLTALKQSGITSVLVVRRCLPVVTERSRASARLRVLYAIRKRSIYMQHQYDLEDRMFTCQELGLLCRWLREMLPVQRSRST